MQTVVQNKEMKFSEFEKSGVFQKINLKKDFLASHLTDRLEEVSANSVFIAYRGTKFDGHQNIPEAIKKGALAILAQDASHLQAFPQINSAIFNSEGSQSFDKKLDKPEFFRSQLSALAAWFYQNPSRKMKMIGVTGTNGKTSTTYLLEAILNQANLDCGVMGTVDHHLHQSIWTTQLTTPGPLELQQRLTQFLEKGAKACAMEVSSHALSMKRVENVDFDGAIFTNLTQDHLDYHLTMDAYLSAKAMLFEQCLPQSQKPRRIAVLNGEDPASKKINIPPNVEKVFFGEDKTFEYSFEILREGFDGVDLKIRTPRSSGRVLLPLLGRHNVMNMMGALALCESFEIELPTILYSLRSFKGIPGRMESVKNAQGKYVFVDYAHTDDALLKVLGFVHDLREKNYPQSKIYVVFGCGGDRDALKRPQMARAAIRFSDHVIVTSDNPRSEDPERIISEILAGYQNSELLTRVKSFVDRRQAIQHAIQSANPNDIVLIAGKGHEKFQIIGQQRLPFDDVEVAKEYLR